MHHLGAFSFKIIGKMKKVCLFGLTCVAIISIALSCGGGDVNTNFDSHFNDDVTLIPDTTISAFQSERPKKVKFYVEVSG